jgi:hypothetical protein
VADPVLQQVAHSPGARLEQPGGVPGGLPARCYEVYASGSVLSDHDSYLASQDQVLPRLLNDLIAAAYPPLTTHGTSPVLVHEDDIHQASRHRRHLIDALIASRVLTFGVAAGLWVLPARWPIIRLVSDAMRILGRPATAGGVIPHLTFVIACMIICYAIVGVIPSKIMENRSYHTFFRIARRPDDPVSRPDGEDTHPQTLSRERRDESRPSHLAAG